MGATADCRLNATCGAYAEVSSATREGRGGPHQNASKQYVALPGSWLAGTQPAGHSQQRSTASTSNHTDCALKASQLRLYPSPRLTLHHNLEEAGDLGVQLDCTGRRQSTGERDHTTGAQEGKVGMGSQLVTMPLKGMSGSPCRHRPGRAPAPRSARARYPIRCGRL